MASIALRYLPLVGNIYTIAQQGLPAKIGQAIGSSPRKEHPTVAVVHVGKVEEPEAISCSLPRIYLGEFTETPARTAIFYQTLFERCMLTTEYFDTLICAVPDRTISYTTVGTITTALSQSVLTPNNHIFLGSETIKTIDLAKAMWPQQETIFLETTSKLFDEAIALAEPNMHMEHRIHPDALNIDDLIALICASKIIN
jgi:hypothetical protein